MRDLLGDPHLVGRLGERIASGEVSHAYLITGPRSIGKRTLALRIAQTLVCGRGSFALSARLPQGSNADALFTSGASLVAPGASALGLGHPPRSSRLEDSREPAEPDSRSALPGGCGACLACRKVEHGTHPDVRELGVLPEKRDISIDQVREMARDLSLRPIESGWRAVIIDDAAELSEDAEDALLKTLEEPPRRAVIILVARAPDAVAETLVSRCQHIALRPQPVSPIEALVTERTGDPAVARQVAPLAGGRPGLALELAGDPEGRREREALADELFTLLGLGIIARFGWARRAAEYAEGREEREAVRRALDERFTLWLELVRDAALARDAVPLRPDRADRTARLGARIDRARLAGVAELLVRLRSDLARNSNFRAAAELLMLRLPYVPDLERATA